MQGWSILSSLYYNNRSFIMYSNKSILIIISQLESNCIKIKVEVNIFFNYLKTALASFNYLKITSFLMSFINNLAISKNCLIKWWIEISKFYKYIYIFNKVRCFLFNYSFNLYWIHTNILAYFNDKLKIFYELYLKLAFINV